MQRKWIGKNVCEKCMAFFAVERKVDYKETFIVGKVKLSAEQELFTKRDSYLGRGLALWLVRVRVLFQENADHKNMWIIVWI